MIIIYMRRGGPGIQRISGEKRRSGNVDQILSEGGDGPRRAKWDDMSIRIMRALPVRPSERPAVVEELKYNQSAEAAIEQIRRRRYP